MPGLDLDPLRILAFLLAMVVGVTFHELMHAVAANYLGDPTGKYMGRITLNPIKHFDALGAFLLFIMAIYGFGFTYGKPVQVNPRNLRPDPQKGMAIVAAAGPFANLVIAIISGLALRFIIVSPFALAVPSTLIMILSVMLTVNLLLLFFNLIPIPPLDGYKILQLFFTPRMYYELSRFEQYGPMLLLLLLFIPGGANLLFGVIRPPMQALTQLIVGG